MAGMTQALCSNVLNATLPTATGGKPTAFTAMATASAMTLRLASTQSTNTAAGTELPNGTGYTTNGPALGVSTPSSSGSAVTLPASQITLTCTSTGWTVDSYDIVDSSQARGWFGRFTGAGVVVAVGNIAQIAANAISVGLS